jgi:hypothetical protein
MFTKKSTPQFEFGNRLDQLLAAAASAGVGAVAIEAELKKQLAILRSRAAANLNLSTTPATFDGHGRVRR